jgi:hypothetical protein
MDIRTYKKLLFFLETRVASFLVYDIKTGKMYQINTKCTKLTQNVPNGHKISEMSVKYSRYMYQQFKI